MQYLERTLQVKAALLERPDLLEKIRSIFASHVTQDGVIETIGQGNSRFTYEVGECQVSPDVKVNLILKLKKELDRMKYSKASACNEFSDWSEIGAFEMYYDFVAGHISTISFRSKAAWERYRSKSILGRDVKQTFSLSENWGGTKVAQGDMGAIPYFQLVVRHKGLFGYLTEGEPPYVEPKGTADYHGTMDEYTVEGSRIIDIGPTQCLLIDIDRGGHLRFDERWPGNIGMRKKASKYFRLENRLEL